MVATVKVLACAVGTPVASSYGVPLVMQPLKRYIIPATICPEVDDDVNVSVVPSSLPTARFQYHAAERFASTYS
jgi:hypothetical protein